MKKVLYLLSALIYMQLSYATITFVDITPNGTVIYNGSGTGTPYSYTVLSYQFNLRYDTSGFHFYTTVPTDQLIGAVTGSGNLLDGYTGGIDLISSTSSDWVNDASMDPSWDWGTMLAFRIPAGGSSYKYAWLWIDLQVGTSVTVFSYGYENVLDAQILAGQMSGGASTGLEGEDNSSLSVFPNPASDFITIENYQLQNISEINIIDLSGKLILSSILNSNKATFDISGIRNGIYMVNIHLSNGQYIFKKMIVEL